MTASAEWVYCPACDRPLTLHALAVENIGRVISCPFCGVRLVFEEPGKLVLSRVYRALRVET